MRKQFLGIARKLATAPDRIKLKMSAIIAPLNGRERLIYSVLILGFISLMIAPRIIADVGDEGSVFGVAATQCSSTEAWLYPENATGQPSLHSSTARSDITAGNSSVWTGIAGSLTCSGYSPIIDHSQTKNGVRLTLKSVNAVDEVANISVENEAELSSSSAALLDGAVLNERIDDARLLIEPNEYGTERETASIDAAVTLLVSNDKEKTWQPLHSFGSELAAVEQITYDIALPPQLFTNAGDLAFRIETPGNDNSYTVFVESIVWTYEVGAKQEITASLLNPDGSGVRTESLPTLNSPKDLKFEVGIKNPKDGFWQGVRSQATSVVGSIDEELIVDAVLLDSEGNLVKTADLEADYIDTDVSNRKTWDVDASVIPNSLDPGQYSLELHLTDSSGNEQTITQDFLWGVLAMNLDKASYQAGDTALVAMSVLDELGGSVCDASLTLTIDGPNNVNTYATGDNTITTSETCNVYSGQTNPDYLTQHYFQDLGAYELRLDATTANGSFTIYSSVEVLSEPSFEISRDGPTRIFPVVEYPMSMSVYSKDGYTGPITEVVPLSFEIRANNNTQVYDSIVAKGADQILTWKVNIPAGGSVNLGYIFDAPDISPEFYLLGPLTLGDPNNPEFTEQRSWQLAGDAVGRMIVFYNGATTPSGWTCVSCISGDDFFQRFVKGAATYGATGGATTHAHTASTTVNASALASTEDKAGSFISDSSHSHSGSVTLPTANNLPSYRNLKLIRFNTTGAPTTLPAGTVGVFDTTTLPSGWTRYSAQDNFYARGEGTIGGTAGANTHTVAISTTLGAASTTLERDTRGGGVQVTGASSLHTHTVTGTSASASNEPPNIQVVLASISTAQSIPNGLISMWDDEAPAAWDRVSDSGGAFNARYIKGAATYGTTGGALTHTHTNTTGLVSSLPSATGNARAGVNGASNVHTHLVDVTGYSTLNHEPLFREAVFAKFNPVTKFEQSSYRFFENDNSANVGTALAAQNTSADTPAQGVPFRLRANVHVSVLNLATSGQNFKLQYAEKSGTCDVAFSGESFLDVGTASGAIRYYDNPTPSDGGALTSNASDPTHGGDTVTTQTYEEANNFTNSQSAINIGQDGLWDFSLVDISATAETDYCFRVVKSDGSLLDTYTVVPQIHTPPTPPRMILMYDGATIPSGWTCISCTSGDDAYRRFLRGEATYGGTGGAITHTHTATGAVGTSVSTESGTDRPGSGISDQSHGHTYSPTLASGSNLPAYRQLKIIRYDAGTPATIPSGAIGLFSATVPSGWTRYSAQDGSFVRGEGTATTTGGSNTHTHTFSGTTSAATGAVSDTQTGGTQVNVATETHTHTVSGTSTSVDLQPPFIQTILGKADASTTLPSSFISMWDKDPAGTWTCLSCTGTDAFYQRFFKPSATHGTTGGAVNHSHANSVFDSAAPTGATTNRDGTANASDTHVHPITVSSISTDGHLPPYLNVIFAQSASSNAAPNSPSALDQQKSDTTSIAVGAWTNEDSVVFEAQVSDPDNPDNLSLCVELQPIGTPFTNTETTCGSSVSYTGTALSASATIASLTDAETYHWQARVKDSIGAYSAWISFGANLESASDFGVDTSAPTGTVYDGTVSMTDLEFNTGALDTLSANWTVDSTASGLSGFDYSIGTSPGATDVKAWTANGTTSSVTDAGLTLNTSQPYYFNIRTTDNAGSQSTISSDGQFVAPTLNFTLTGSTVDLGNLNAGNAYTATDTTILTTSTNAYNGYVIRGYATGLLSNGVDTIGMFNGGTYASPDQWLGGDTGYGYTSSDPLIQGSDIFNNSPCPGGGSPSCYAPWSLTAPGDIIADNTSTISGTPIVNESFTITHRVTSSSAQASGEYTTTIIYNITARY